MTSYLFLPILLIDILCLVLKKYFNSSLIDRFISIYILLIFFLVVSIIATDIGFYLEFNSRINYIIFEYLDESLLMLKSVIFQFPYNLIFCSVIILFYFLKNQTKTLRLSMIYTTHNISAVKSLSTNLLLFIMLSVFIRGGFQDKPLHWSHANISNKPFYNQLTMNPVWTLGFTYFKSRNDNLIKKFKDINLINSIKIARDVIDTENSKFYDDRKPLLRTTDYGEIINKYNIVLIILEGFASQYVGAFGSDYNVTPEFDKLSKNGVLFSRMFSAGTRTNRGVAASVLSFPPIPKYNSIQKDNFSTNEFSSLANILKQRNYKNKFFSGSSLNYHNRYNFMSSNGFDNFWGQSNAPDTAFRTMWGVSDKLLLDTLLNSIKQETSPFFYTALTISNHPPYNVPKNNLIDYSNIKIKSNRLKAFKYSDWAIANFIDKCDEAGITKNTIFVIVGDHGFPNLKKEYKHFDLTKYHVPLLILSPNLGPGTNNKIASQTDIVPTILSLLGGKFLHHSWGKNLFSKNKSNNFAIMVPAGSNNLMAMIDEKNLLVHDFINGSISYSIKWKKPMISLSIDTLKYDTNKFNFLFAYMKASTNCLLNNQCGISYEN